MPLSRKASPVVSSCLRTRAAEVDGLDGQQQAGPLGLGQRREIVEQSGEPHGLLMHRREVGRLIAEHAVLGGLDAPQEAVDRRAQLVCQVCDALLAQLLLALQRLCQPVQRLTDGVDLVVAAFLHAGVELAGAHRLCAGADAPQRARKRQGEVERDRQGDRR